MRSLLLLLAVLPVAACSHVEGYRTGDCTDRADNDEDGLYDCDDPDCAGSPDCTDDTGGPGPDEDTDTDADADTDTDSDADTDTDADSDADADPVYTVCDDGKAPYDEIQDAVDEATDGDVITVCAGTYPSVTVDRTDLSIVGIDGAELTVVDGGSDPAITAEDVELSLTGLTLTGRPAASGVAALSTESSTVILSACRVADSETEGTYSGTHAINSNDTELTIDHCTFEDNAIMVLVYAYGGGSMSVLHSLFRDNAPQPGGTGGLLVFGVDTDVEVHNNLFVNNVGTSSYGLVTFGYAGFSAWVYNNAFYGNINGFEGYGMVEARNPSDFENNILWSNDGLGVFGESGANVEYNDAYANTDGNFDLTDELSRSNIMSDPRFVDPDAGDFTLDPGFSPCIDAGNPLSGYNDPDDTRNDMGAFGGSGGGWVPGW